MKFHLSAGFVVTACILLASCYPVDEHGRYMGRPYGRHARTTETTQTTQTTQNTDKLKPQEDVKRKQQQDALVQPKRTDDDPGTVIEPSERTEPTVEPKRDYAFATKAPGREGFVLSPYNNKLIDVRGILSGTLVQDPTYPAAEMKYFRVP